jgi:UDP-GlcNAc:undecaprenyl-phosphate GlcNAc-1-phosphate transferase
MSIITIKIVFSFIFSFIITLYLVPFFCSLARTLRFVDVPDGKIKRHSQETPYFGGVAIYCGFLCGLAFTMPFENRVFLLLIGTTLLLLLGLIDDLIPLRAYQKFFGQFIVALCFLKSGFYLKEHLFYNIWNMPLSLLWILTVINSFNLVDVMDGLATLLAISATITFMAIAAYLHHTIVLILLVAFLGPLCAFFLYNRPTARIYLGDAGSLFIGGFLATIPFLFDWGTYNRLGYLAPSIILAIPLLECTSLIFIRTIKGIPFYRGSLDHFSSYLLAHGWTKKTILLYVTALSLYLGLVSYFFTIGMLVIMPTILLGALFLFVWIGAILWR